MKNYFFKFGAMILGVSLLGIAFGFGHGKKQVTGVTITTPVQGSDSSWAAAIGDLQGSRAQDESTIATQAGYLAYLTNRVQLLEAHDGLTPPPCPTTAGCVPGGTTTPPTGGTTPPASGVLAIGASVTQTIACNVWPSVVAAGGVSGTPTSLSSGTGTVLAGPITSANGNIWWQIKFPSFTGWEGSGCFNVN
jgi:hypothetical protein